MKPRLAYLSDDEIGTIHGAALEILSRIGMKLPHPEARELLLAEGGQEVAGEVVRIPAELVEWAIEQVPKRDQVVLFGREAAHDFAFASDGPALSSMTMAIAVIDPETGKKRPATNDDLAKLTRINHALPNIRVNGGLITPQEVPGAVNDWYTWATCLKNTTKHITGGVLGERGVRDAVAMAQLALGEDREFKDRPCISGWALALPPLGFDTDTLGALMEMARQGMPAILSSGPILGTTSPVTIAGTLAQAHAEILAGLTIAQLARPGAPVIYTSFARGTDMRTGTISMACPEFAILKAAMAQLGRRLNMPIRMPALLRDSKLLDAQAGFETGMVGSVASFGADLMDSMQLDMDMVADYADGPFCNEAMSGLIRLNRELTIDDESLSLDVIEAVGPAGTFLTNRHTMLNFRKELWHPEIFERRTWGPWEADGARDIRAVCLDRAKEILAEDREPLLTPATEAAIDGIVETARLDYS